MIALDLPLWTAWSAHRCERAILVPRVLWAWWSARGWVGEA